MLRLSQQLALLQQQSLAASLAAARSLTPILTEQRCYQTAADCTATTELPRQQPFNGAQFQHQEAGQAEARSWTPIRSLPPPAYYGVQVLIKAHDLHFVKLASTVIRDLALVNFAPKSRDVVPSKMRRRHNVPWVNLAIPVGDAALPTRRTHFTVIRGPHVHKSSREQFARITHQRLVEYSTNNLSELNWFLHSIKLYKFIAVELTVKVSSSSYLLPTTSEQQAAADQPLLLQHKQRFAHLFGGAAPSSNSSLTGLQQQQESSSSEYSHAALQKSLQGLRQSLHEGLLQQRMKLVGNAKFKRWQTQSRGAAPAATASSTAAGLDDLVSQQLQGSSLADTEKYQKQHAFLAAVDKALLRMKVDVLDRHKYYPYLMAFYQYGQQKTPPADWMHAMLKYGKMRQQEMETSQTAAALEMYQQYSEVTQTLLMQMLQQWYQAADGSSRRELGLPDAEYVDDMLEFAAHHLREEKAPSAAASAALPPAVTSIDTWRPPATEAESDQRVAASESDYSAEEEDVYDRGEDVGLEPGGRRGWGSGQKVDRYRPAGPGPRVDRFTPQKD